MTQDLIDDMKIYDLLPRSIRDEIKYSVVGFSMVDIYSVFLSHGETSTILAIRRANNHVASGSKKRT